MYRRVAVCLVAPHVLTEVSGIASQEAVPVSAVEVTTSVHVLDTEEVRSVLVFNYLSITIILY